MIDLRKAKDIIDDKCGLIHSTELLLSIIMLVFIIGIIANLSDELNERILSEEESSSLENMAVATSDYLLNNPGNPENWERDERLDNGIVSPNIIPGLAIKKKNIENGEFYDESDDDEMIMTNAISYHKLERIKSNYDKLIDGNLLNGSFKSSMAVYPLNEKMEPILMGDDIDGDDNVNDINIAVVNRTVQCDFLSSFVVYDFNDLELYGDDYTRDVSCNHDSDSNLENHANDGRSLWLCKNFRVYKKSLENYDYYLISDESIKTSNSYWILESLNKPHDNRQRLDREVMELNTFFSEDLENSSNEIYSIHFNIDRNHVNDFKTVLVALPKNMTNDLLAKNELKYDYFKSQEVNYVLKIAYN